MIFPPLASRSSLESPTDTIPPSQLIESAAASDDASPREPRTSRRATVVRMTSDRSSSCGTEGPARRPGLLCLCDLLRVSSPSISGCDDAGPAAPSASGSVVGIFATPGRAACWSHPIAPPEAAHGPSRGFAGSVLNSRYGLLPRPAASRPARHGPACPHGSGPGAVACCARRHTATSPPLRGALRARSHLGGPGHGIEPVGHRRRALGHPLLVTPHGNHQHPPPLCH